MKYIFIAHSHTLFLTAMGTIRYLNIAYEDVFFICTRNYDTKLIPDCCVKIRGEKIYQWSDEIYYSKDKSFIKERLKFLDNYIGELIHDDYELFVPHLSDPLFQILYTHKRCRKVSYVQEGAYTASGWFLSKVPWYRKVRRKINLVRHYGNTRFYCNLSLWYMDGVLRNQKDLDAYVIYEDFFDGLDCVPRIVSWPNYDIELPDRIDGPVFVFDGFVKNGLSDSDYYLEKCKLLISRFHQAKNMVKFHPAQSKEECNTILSFFKELGANCREMDESIPFELYIIKEKMMTVVGMGSSLLYYAHSRGHHVICCDTWMMNDAKYRHNHDRGYPFFHEFFNIQSVSEH